MSFSDYSMLRDSGVHSYFAVHFTVSLIHCLLYFWYWVFDTVPLQLVLFTACCTFGTGSLTPSSLQLVLGTVGSTFGTGYLIPSSLQLVFGTFSRTFGTEYLKLSLYS